jgi:translation initiation factor 4G
MTLAEIHAEAAKEEEEAKAKGMKVKGMKAKGMKAKQHNNSSLFSSSRRNFNMNEKEEEEEEEEEDGGGWETVGASSSSSNNPKTIGSRPRLMIKSKSTAAILPRNAYGRKKNRKSPSPPRKTTHSPMTQQQQQPEEEEKEEETIEKKEKKTVEEAEEVLTKQEFEKKIKCIVDEFLEIRNMDDVVHYITALKSHVHHGWIPIQTINFGLEKNPRTHKAIGAFLSGLYERQLLTSDHLINGLKDILESVEDIEIDIPYTLQYVSEMIEPSVSQGAFTYENLVSTMDHLRYNGKASVLMANIVKQMKDTKGQEFVMYFLGKEKKEQNKKNLMSLLKEEERHEDGIRMFLQTHALEFLI